MAQFLGLNATTSLNQKHQSTEETQVTDSNMGKSFTGLIFVCQQIHEGRNTALCTLFSL